MLAYFRLFYVSKICYGVQFFSYVIAFETFLLINGLWFPLIVFRLCRASLFCLCTNFAKFKNPFLLGKMDWVANLTLGELT